MHRRTHIHRTKIVTTMSRLPASRLDKKYVEIQQFDILGNKTVKTFFFLVQMFYSPMGYLASIMF